MSRQEQSAPCNRILSSEQGIDARHVGLGHPAAGMNNSIVKFQHWRQATASPRDGPPDALFVSAITILELETGFGRELARLVLLTMREQRSGLIVNVSSIGGLASFAATGYYHGTKYAVEGISESLALEVAPLGIGVLIVEPGPFRTNWAGPSIKQSATTIADYAATSGERRKQTAARSGKQPGDPVRAAQAIIDAALSEKPPLRLLLGKMALEVARKKIASMNSDFDAWEKTTLGADLPGEG